MQNIEQGIQKAEGIISSYFAFLVLQSAFLQVLYVSSQTRLKLEL